MLGGRERAVGRRPVHRDVIVVIEMVNCVAGRDSEMREAMAEGTDTQGMQTEAFRSKCCRVT